MGNHHGDISWNLNLLKPREFKQLGRIELIRDFCVCKVLNANGQMGFNKYHNASNFDQEQSYHITSPISLIFGSYPSIIALDYAKTWALIFPR
jgi:hypothetical protein